MAPQPMVIEFQQVAQASGASEVFSRMVEWIDRQISKAVLGQTATTEGTPGKLGNEASQEAVRQDIIAADARQLANTLNRPYIDINYGPQAVYPRVMITLPEKEDVTALAANLEKLVPLGLKVSASEVRNKLGLSEPAKEADLLSVSKITAQASATNRAQGKGYPCSACSSRAVNRSQADETDLLASDMLTDWEPQITPVTAPVMEAIKRVEDYDQLIALLPQLLDKADVKKLTESLAQAGLMAYGTGVEGQE